MCRMLVAVGDFDCGKLFDSAIAMARDETSEHEYHSMVGGKGNFKHQDGWGISYIDSQGKWQVFKSTTAIFEDPQVALYRDLKSSYVMIHIRYAKGSETDIKNTHPFYINRNDVGEFVFCHNGFVPSEVSHCPSFTLQGKTDSEQIFYSVLSHSKEKELRESVRQAVQSLDTPYGSNIILSSKDRSYIMIANNSKPKYYQMAIGSNDKAIIVSSEALVHHDNFTWKLAPVNVPITLDHRRLSWDGFSSDKSPSSDMMVHRAS